MTHPLTDEIIDSIAGLNKTYEYDMRSAADWQLEQVIDWLEKSKGGTLQLDSIEIDNIVYCLEKAMRPQEDS